MGEEGGTPESRVQLADHRLNHLLSETAVTLEQLLAVAATHNFHDDRNLVRTLVEVAPSNEAGMLPNLLEKRGLAADELREPSPDRPVLLPLRELAREQTTCCLLASNVHARRHAITEPALERVLAAERASRHVHHLGQMVVLLLLLLLWRGRRPHLWRTTGRWIRGRQSPAGPPRCDLLRI